MSQQKALIFHHGIVGSGGSERITLEEEKYFNAMGIETEILSFHFNPAVFYGSYTPKLRLLQPGMLSSSMPVNIFKKIICLRKVIREIQPDFILGSGEVASIYLFFATLFTKHSYSTHVPQTIFWDLETYGDVWDTTPFLLGRYSLVFKSVYAQIRNATAGHMESLPPTPPHMSFRKRILAEALGLATFIGARRARYLFVHSNIMAWEVEKMYRRNAVVLKGAYPRSVITYKPNEDVKERLSIRGKKMILSICRLTEKKRVDLTIRAFALLAAKRNDVALVVGGSGNAEEELRALAESLHLQEKAFFAGFIHENKMYDYYSACDVFVSADHADYDITTYMALGFGKKVVWSIENETDPNLLAEHGVFPAELTPESFAEKMNDALESRIGSYRAADEFSWETYFQSIVQHLRSSALSTSGRVLL